LISRRNSRPNEKIVFDKGSPTCKPKERMSNAQVWSREEKLGRRSFKYPKTER